MQLVHDDDAMDEIVPPGQTEHAASPVAEAYKPAAQDMHADAPVAGA